METAQTMEKPTKKAAGRPPVPENLLKKKRTLSFTDGEYNNLVKLAQAAGAASTSAFITKKLKL